ncbi:MAG TPA: cyclophilin-like fold protein [Burkholderiales bacterium]|nr:cyclophilin-like fold protein [Burkholderiales bacterium]
MRMLAGYVALALSLALSQPAAGAGDRAAEKGPATGVSAVSSRETSNMRIRLTINGTAITASLNDNATARDFLSLLPLTLTLEDYAATEKIAYLPRKLSTAGAPAGFDPSIGDITYYAPWGNLAIFHKDFGYSEGLVHLGRIDSGIEALKVRGALKATIERIEK